MIKNQALPVGESRSNVRIESSASDTGTGEDPEIGIGSKNRARSVLGELVQSRGGRKDTLPEVERKEV